MARNRASGTVVVGVGLVFLAVAGGVAWRMISGSPDAADNFPVESRGAAGNASTGTAPAAADRPGETVQALAADQENMRTRMDVISDSVESGIGSLTEQIGQLGQDLTSLRTAQESNAERAGTQEQIDQFRVEMLASMQAMLDNFENRTGADYPVGGVSSGQDIGVPGQDGYLWYSAANPEPVGGAVPGTGLATLQERFSALGATPLALDQSGDIPPEPLPVYTVPADAILAGSTSLTALIGRVPLQGQLVDPFPFKIIAGPDNLLAGGQTLPELERTIWSGVARGDATLHCVSGEITQATFIFRDGTISSWPPADGGDSAGTGSLGWISDEQGYPCIPGKFVSNLQENIGKFTSASVASSLARAWSEKQATTTRDGTAVTRSITGNAGEYALGQGISGGIDEWARIVVERAREAFDAVVVPPGQILTVHVNNAIPIDWPPAGRRLRHVATAQSPDSGERSGGLD